MTTKDSLRAGLGLTPQAKVAFVVWESQTEQAWRAALPALLTRFDFLLVYPHGSIATTRHFRVYGKGNNPKIMLVDDWEMRKAADEVLMFRVIEALGTDNLSVRIIDPANRWLSKELSQ